MASIHGLLMVFGFLGTVIALERAALMQSSRETSALWAFVAPAASVAGVLLALIQVLAFPDSASRLSPALAWTIAMASLVVVYVLLWRRSPSSAVVIQGVGGLAGLIGIVLWGLGVSQWIVVPWWLLFLILTVVGERVGRARATFGNAPAHRVLVESILAFVVLAVTFVQPDLVYPFFGMALVVLMIDVLLHDTALKAISSEGQTKFTAAAMLTAYAWAIFAGILWVLYGPLQVGFPYDAVIHAVTIGFALSMVMAHAPIIVPIITGKAVPYSPLTWVVWGLLQGGLVLRIVASTHTLDWLWQAGGVVDIFAILAFVVLLPALILVGGKQTPTEDVDR